MRKPILAGNWKMNLLRQEVADLLDGLKSGVSGVDDREILVCPAFPYLAQAATALAGTSVQVGAQNCCWESKGAFTGEVSPSMLKDVGCSRVILGHSERRHVMGETDALINKKLHLTLQTGLGPILCVGETLEERQAKRTWEVIERQLVNGLEGLGADATDSLVIAYEPVWAIGTGLTATPEQAQEVHAQIRTWTRSRFDERVSQDLRILYGGSVNPTTVDGLMAMEDVDGGLVGGASMKVEDFTRIVRFQNT